MDDFVQVYLLDEHNKWYASCEADFQYIPATGIKLTPLLPPLILLTEHLPFAFNTLICLQKIQDFQREVTILHLKINQKKVALSFSNYFTIEVIASLLQIELFDKVAIQKKQFLEIEIAEIFKTKLKDKSKQQKLKTYKKYLKKILNAQENRFLSTISSFTAAKSFILNADKDCFQLLLDDQIYPIILECLSRDNNYTNVAFNYKERFQAIRLCPISLFQHPSILEPYSFLRKVNFLKNNALCIFLQANNQRVFLNFIKFYSIKVLISILELKDIFQNLKKQSPETYINVYFQIWSLFKNVDFQNTTLNFKEQFYQYNQSFELHQHGVKCIQTILSNNSNVPIQQTFKSQSREQKYFLKWMEIYRIIICDNFSKLQNLLLLQVETVKSTTFQFIPQFFQIFNKSHYNCKNVVLTSITTILASLNLEKNKVKIKNAIFEKCIQLIVKTNPSDYVLKFSCNWYQTQPNRMRRVFIKYNTLGKLDLTKKSIVICAIKLLIVFKQSNNHFIFQYLQQTKVFDGLKQQFKIYQGKKNCLINSLFRCLFKCTEGPSGLATQYLTNLFLQKNL